MEKIKQEIKTTFHGWTGRECKGNLGGTNK